METKEVTIGEKIAAEKERTSRIDGIAQKVAEVILEKEISLIEAEEVLEKADYLLKVSINLF